MKQGEIPILAEVGATGLRGAPTLTVEGSGRFEFRKNLIHMVLHEVLLKAGIPGEWIRADVLLVSSDAREPAVHVRFVMIHWDEMLVKFAPTLQYKFKLRVLAMDTVAPQWLSGISWQFPDDVDLELPELPPPTRWARRPPA